MTELRTRGPTRAASRADIVSLHEFEDWPARWMWPLVFAGVALGLAAVFAADHCWPLLPVIWPALGAVMFVFVLAFHDASHGRLHPVRWMNEMYGHELGTVVFTPLNVYRYAHARHHAQLARPGDPELWPFNSPTAPRALRILAAFCEIFLGPVYSPLLFLRAVLIGPLTPRERRLILRGYFACACFWALLLLVVYQFDLWKPLIISMVVPMFISGMLQTLNKYEQHLGLHGQSVLGLTRTVVDRHKFSEMVSAAMLFNDYHGTHHRYAKIPYYHLPPATPYTLAGANEPCPVYPSVLSATFDMLRCLADPKAGPQWLPHSDTEQQETGEDLRTVGSISHPMLTPAYKD